jgi:hypothetical protein
MFAATIDTAGERVEIRCPTAWIGRLLAECASGAIDRPETGSMRVVVDAAREPFDPSHLSPIGRGAWADEGRLVARDVSGSGFDMSLVIDDGVPEFTFRWRPSARTLGLAAADRARARLLARAALLHYPALWVAGARGRAPIHAPALRTARDVVLHAGPSGVGKTTLIERETAAGSAATGDNVSVTDGTTVWGLTEPIRSETGRGRRMPHGRRESTLRNRVASLVPDRILILSRGRGRVEPCDDGAAVREIVASTYMAGELRRFWPYASMLALATGIGPVHPLVGEAAQRLTLRLPSDRLLLRPGEAPGLGALMDAGGRSAWT